MNEVGQTAERSMVTGDLEAGLALNTMANRQRDRDDLRTAGILGYTGLLGRAWDRPGAGPSRDTLAELETNRYFVVLKAYDFQALWKHRTAKLLWEMRYSVAEHGERFDEKLAAMSQTAAPLFGQDVSELVRKPLPTGRVEVGTPTVVEQDAK